VLMNFMQNVWISGLRTTVLVQSAVAMHQTIFKRFPNNIPVGLLHFSVKLRSARNYKKNPKFPHCGSDLRNFHQLGVWFFCSGENSTRC